MPKSLKKIAHDSEASQDPFELWNLLEVLADYAPRKILEIGVDRGLSCKAWHNAFPEADVYGIESQPENLAYKNFNLIEGNSHHQSTRTTALEFGPFDFLFIDGDHTYEGVNKDWNMYAPLVRPGGIVAFHDTRRLGEYWKGKVEVARLFRTLQQNNKSIEFWGESDTSPGTGVIFL